MYLKLLQIKPYRGFLCYLALMVGLGCNTKPGQNDREVSTDFVVNPITASDRDKTVEVPEATFAESEFDFGKIIQGEKVSHSFSFTNTGKRPLIISDVSATCGCTVPSWPKEPVLPGEKGNISVIFDSDGKKGSQLKQITVLTNAVPSTKVLNIKGEIIVPNNN